MFQELPTILLASPNYCNGHGDPIYAHMVSVCDNKCKYLIQFPISTELEKVRNSVESSKCFTVLLKADTGADVNLMDSKTFDSLFHRKHLQFTSLRMEAYDNHSAWKFLENPMHSLNGKVRFTGNFSM